MSGKCQIIPCGGKCQADEICIANTCRSANGADCSSDASRCPSNYTCTAGKCRQSCTQDSDCPPATPSCNLDLNGGVCTGCTFNTDCKSASAPICDPNSGNCVGCLTTPDCQPQHVPNGMYCDGNTSSCQLGCNSVADCPVGTQGCQGASAGVPGKCIQCQQDTDCFSSSMAVCNPRTNLCVQCLEDSQCTGVSTRCDTATNTCVACTHDLDCGRGNVCDQSTFTCKPGCSGGFGDALCPPTTPVCLASMGPNGTCVACQQDSDCPYMQICDTMTNTCAAGCHTDAQCIPPAGATAQQQKATTCDPQKNTMGSDGSTSHGTCVQCRTNADCTSGEECDTTTEFCRCKGIGESCSSTSQCGYDPTLTSPTMGCSDTERTAHNALCVKSIRCNQQSTIMSISASVCVMAGVNQGIPDYCPPKTDGCPSGYAVEYASDGNSTYTAVCVPNSSPYVCTCPGSPF